MYIDTAHTKFNSDQFSAENCIQPKYIYKRGSVCVPVECMIRYRINEMIVIILKALLIQI